MLAGGDSEPVQNRASNLLFIPMFEKTGDYIRVLYPSGALYRNVTAFEARRLIRSGVAEGLGTRTKLRTVQLLAGPARPVAGTKYSFDHETDENPVNVFTFRKITNLERDLFMQVQTDCLNGGLARGIPFVPQINDPAAFAR